MDGGSPKDLLESESSRSSFALEESLHVTLQVARGLAHLHDTSVCHKDFKSENILLKRVGPGTM